MTHEIIVPNITALTFANYHGPLPDRPLLPRALSIIEQQLPINSSLITFHAFGLEMFEFPHSSIYPAVAVPLYLAMVFILPYFIHKKRECKLAMQIWNFLLTVLSLAMFVTWSTAIYSDIQLYSNPIYYLTCLPGGSLTVGLVPIAAITFMISKYLELVDTLFLILKQKEIIFLHWYHHTTVLVYTWFTVILMYPPGSIFGIVNSFVHTLMYSYYFLASFGHRPWWGKYVTRIQMTQMIVGIVATTCWAYFYYFSDKPCGFWSPQAKSISVYGYNAESVVFIATLVMYASYFVLFLQFYLNRFVTPEASSAPKGKVAATTQAQGKGKGKGKGAAGNKNEKKKNK